jgi:hypothetical protein
VSHTDEEIYRAMFKSWLIGILIGLVLSAPMVYLLLVMIR